MLKTLDSLDYQHMTPIQAQTLPDILKRRDILAQAMTGSGKTAAFGIGLLSKLNTNQQFVQSLVLCPTRELAEQVSQELRRLARLIPNARIMTLCGGTPLRTQAVSLENGAHIVVGTPGRILDHLGRGILKLSNLSTLVLDEADRMLDMGFQEELNKIISTLPTKRQTLLFSATYPDVIQHISQKYLDNPVEVRIDSIHNESTIKQEFYQVNVSERQNALLGLLCHYKPESSIIFCNTKMKCQEVERFLNASGFHALSLHGDLDQRQRNKILIQFANKSCAILVATDLAARGLDIDSLAAVINYELADSAETHMHRIGRTGRAGHSGLALSLFQPSEVRKREAIEAHQGAPIALGSVESLNIDPDYSQQAKMKTLCIWGGKKQKLRPGDIVGALTGSKEITANQIGKIQVSDTSSYVAIENKLASKARQQLENGKIKNRKFKVQIMA
tara:strand:+ start:53346 stop:54686 length:1341 start_codon:yes stop_codon:yes gene_type:complete